MRTQDGFYFSPKNTYMSLHFNDKKEVINAFYERIKGFYIEPANKLDGTFEAFASGVLCVCTIDILARLEYGDNIGVGSRFKKWVRIYLVDDFLIFKLKAMKYNEQLSLDSFLYEYIRNGLVHEGLIKQGFQFSYETSNNLFRFEPDIIIINPKVLLNKVYDSLKAFIKKLNEDNSLYLKFSKQLQKDLKEDLDK
jgi:hypothetical protein